MLVLPVIALMTNLTCMKGTLSQSYLFIVIFHNMKYYLLGILYVIKGNNIPRIRMW